MKTTVPQTALPTQMATDNRLTTIYTTHVLIPKLGPLAAQRYTRLYARLLKDLAAAVELMNLARSFALTHGKPVAIPAPPPPANAPDFRFEPVVKGGNRYLKYYIAGLLPFASARINEARETTLANTSPPPAAKSAAAKKTVSRAETSIISGEANSFDQQQVRFDAGGVWPADVKVLLRDDPQLSVTIDGRLKIEPIGPRQLLARRGAAVRGKQWAKPDKRPVDGDTIGNEANDAAEGYALAQILHGGRGRPATGAPGRDRRPGAGGSLRS
jgi:hypothetical protein